ncbi:hypothetical protein HPB49_021573 [Dermacentor silvarum]|uniref:Uncharacterized protein n=1 Tax=Dermacentor silvarum TaxID=543639 RepID=A0ACB8E394_DERSI|nr:hypothetical protein HPB49_021573 [Dermacentor silvarum]
MGSGSRTFDERFPCFLTAGNSINRRNSESGIDRDQFLQDPIVFRPRDGLNLGAWPQPSVAQAIGIAAGLDSAVLNEPIIRIRTDQNLAVLSTPDENFAARLQRVQFICMGLTQHAVQAYVAAPDNSCTGVVSGLEPNTTTTTLLENLRCSEAPVLHARMMGPTNTALITFSGTHVSHYVRMYGAELRCHVY